MAMATAGVINPTWTPVITKADAHDRAGLIHEGRSHRIIRHVDDLRRLWALGVAREIRVERRGSETAFVVVPRQTVGAVVN